MSESESKNIPYVRPDGLRYENLLPVGLKAKKMKKVFRPINTGKYRHDADNKIILELHGDFFLNARNSYLKFKIDTKGLINDNGATPAAKKVRLDGSAHSFIKSIVIRSGSRELERLSNYSLLHSALADMTLNRDYRSTSGSISEGYDDGFGYMAAQTQNVPSGKTQAYTEKMDGVVFDGAADGTDYVFCINILSGIMQANRYLPLLAMRGSSGLQLEIELEDPKVCFVDADHRTSTESDIVNCQYVMQDVEYHAETLHMGQEFNQGFLNMALSQGLQMHCVGYNHGVNHFDGSVGGEHHIGLSHRFRSLKYLFSILRAKGFENKLNNSAITKRLNNGVEAFRYEIGGSKFPEYDVNVKAAANGSGSAESFNQIELMTGKLGDRLNSSIFTRYNWCPPLTKDEATKNNHIQSRFVIGVELETYGNNNVESGISTSDGAPSMDLVVKTSTDAANIEARVDTYACYDFMLNINPDLTASVSF